MNISQPNPDSPVYQQFNNMLNDKIPVENIARYVNLPLEEVQSLADKLVLNEN